jgi:Tn3 transposase DDE domain
MSVENLSEEQVARYGRFAGDPTPQELEEFFFLDETALELEAQGWGLSSEIRARLSPLGFEHINFHGRYPIVRTHTDG